MSVIFIFIQSVDSNASVCGYYSYAMSDNKIRECVIEICDLEFTTCEDLEEIHVQKRELG